MVDDDFFDAFFDELLSPKENLRGEIIDSDIESALIIRRDGSLYAYSSNYIPDLDFETNIINVANNDQVSLSFSKTSKMKRSMIFFNDKALFLFYFEKKPYALVLISKSTNVLPDEKYIFNKITQIEEAIE